VEDHHDTQPERCGQMLVRPGGIEHDQDPGEQRVSRQQASHLGDEQRPQPERPSRPDPGTQQGQLDPQSEEEHDRRDDVHVHEQSGTLAGEQRSRRDRGHRRGEQHDEHRQSEPSLPHPG